MEQQICSFLQKLQIFVVAYFVSALVFGTFLPFSSSQTGMYRSSQTSLALPLLHIQNDE